MAGDQLARVALTWLVYDRTRSAFLAAVTFVASIVPAFVGGVTLSGLGDKLPRRRVMIVCDLVSAVLVGAMSLPKLPVAALIVLLIAVTMVGALFTAARAAVYPDILSGDRYVLGTAVTVTTYQFAQVLGFAAGGTIIAVFGVRTSLLADAATFAGSALIVRACVRPRPAARPAPGERAVTVAGIISSARLVARNPALLTPMLLGWLWAFANIPEGVVAPLARALDGGSATVGLLLAAGPLGSVLGSLAYSRLLAPPARLRVAGVLAVLSCGVLVLFFPGPGLTLALLVLTLSGLFTCYQLAANAAFVQAAPPSQRSQAFGLAQGGMSLSQGALMLLAGAAAEHVAPATVIGVGGVIGAAAATLIAFSWSRGDHRA